MSYTYFPDPGHGWLAVPLADVQELGLTKADFSSFSYMKGEVLYLEEDCDAEVFHNAYTNKHGRPPVHRTVHTDSDSIIRTYRRIA